MTRLNKHFGLLVLVATTIGALPGAAEDRFVYLFGLRGRFVKVELSSGRPVSVWQMAWSDGWMDKLLPTAGDRIESGPVITRPVYDQDHNRLFVAVDMQSDQPRDVEATDWKVVALDIPSMRVAATVDEPGADSQPQHVVVPRGRSEVWVSYSLKLPDSDSPNSYVVVYDATSLTELKRFTRMSDTNYSGRAAERPAQFWGPVHFLGSGDVAYRGFRRIQFEGNLIRQTRDDFHRQLTEEQRDLIRGIGNSADPLVFAKLDWNESSRVLAHVENSQSRTSLWWTYDTDNEAVLPIFQFELATGLLSPDGTRAVLLAYEKRGEGRPADVVFLGRVGRFDLETGERKNDVIVSEIRGNASESFSVCVSSNGRYLLHYRDPHMYLIDLEEGDTLTIDVFPPITRHWRGCVFTGE